MMIGSGGSRRPRDSPDAIARWVVVGGPRWVVRGGQCCSLSPATAQVVPSPWQATVLGDDPRLVLRDERSPASVAGPDRQTQPSHRSGSAYCCSRTHLQLRPT